MVFWGDPILNMYLRRSRLVNVACGILDLSSVMGEILIQGHGTYGSGVVGFRFDNLIHRYVIFVF